MAAFLSVDALFRENWHGQDPKTGSFWVPDWPRAAGQRLRNDEAKVFVIRTLHDTSGSDTALGKSLAGGTIRTVFGHLGPPKLRQLLHLVPSRTPFVRKGYDGGIGWVSAAYTGRNAAGIWDGTVDRTVPRIICREGLF